MMLPFLKNRKWPRLAPRPEEKMVNPSASDILEDFCIGELMDAASTKNISAFRKSLEALVINCFEEDEVSHG